VLLVGDRAERGERRTGDDGVMKRRTCVEQRHARRFRHGNDHLCAVLSYDVRHGNEELVRATERVGNLDRRRRVPRDAAQRARIAADDDRLVPGAAERPNDGETGALLTIRHEDADSRCHRVIRARVDVSLGRMAFVVRLGSAGWLV